MKKVLFALMLITVAACNNTTETTSVDTTACDSAKCDTACVDTTVTLKADTTVTK
jgi:hypothetical protein